MASTAFTPGHQHSPRKVSTSILSWMNVLGQERPDGGAKHDEDSIRRVAADPRQPIAKRIAARRLLRMLSDKTFGATPLSFAETRDTMDRQLGKPGTEIRMTVEQDSPAPALFERVTTLIASTSAEELPSVWLILRDSVRRLGPPGLEAARGAFERRGDECVEYVREIDTMLTPAMDQAPSVLPKTADDE